MRIWIALVALAGCATRLPLDNGAPPDLGGASGGDLGGDLGTSDLARAPDLSPADPDGGVPFGVINVINSPLPTDGGTIVSSAGATFANRCQRTPIGPCTRFTCTGMAMHSAGTITISGGAAPESLTYGAAGYGALNSTARLWPPGTSLTLSAPGAEVPGWNALLTMPANVTFSAPNLAGTPTVPRTSDLSFAWQGGSQIVSITLVRTGSPVIVCELPAASGAGKIPTAVLQQLAAGTWTISADAIDRVVEPAGLWMIDAVAINQALGANGQLYEGTIQLQ